MVEFYLFWGNAYIFIIIIIILLAKRLPQISQRFFSQFTFKIFDYWGDRAVLQEIRGEFTCCPQLICTFQGYAPFHGLFLVPLFKKNQVSLKEILYRRKFTPFSSNQELFLK